MLKVVIPLALVLLCASASRGQTPPTARDHLNSGLGHFQRGEMDAALADIRNGAALNPRSNSDSSRGSFSSPFSTLNQFIAKHPPDGRAYEVRGILRLLQRKEAEAAEDFKRSLELEPALKAEIDRVREEIGRAAGQPK